MSHRQTLVRVVDRERPDPNTIREAASCLRRGGLVVFPTETVYGLGAHALDADAVAGIFAAKGRPASDPLIVHVASAAHLDAIARTVPPLATTLAAQFWPGPLTMILPKRTIVPAAVTAGLDTVAVRVPSHPVALALLIAAGIPVAAPSANLFSRPSPTQASHVLADLDGRIDMVLDAGPTDIGVESTVLDLAANPPTVRRPGGVSVEALRALMPDLAVVSRVAAAGEAQVAPGQLLRHYAPRARLTLVTGPMPAACRWVAVNAVEASERGRRIGILAPAEDLAFLAEGGRGHRLSRGIVMRPYGSRRRPEQSARELFAVVKSRKVRISINQTYPLREAAQAQRDLEARKTTGSTVLIP